MRRFMLVRSRDVTGISGTGEVAEGVEFTGGVAVIRWLTEWTSTAMYDSVNEMLLIHGHDGATKVKWIDKAKPDK